ncbi:MAG: DUF3618 domain-containing protein [Alphaproteobacteria bacterium]|nr:DUF3618 domain-containing protein [Alphaproteobacteria bacterium]
MTQQDDSSDTIERDIEGTRARIDERLSALQDSVLPTEFAGQAINYARENGAKLASGVGRTVREHPIPSILTAAGITWLLLASRDTSSTGSETVDRAVGKAGDKISSAGSAARDKAGEYAGAARERGGQAASAVNTFAQEHPLAVGAIGLALGAVIGAALSPTRREDELFGDKADRARDHLKTTTRETVDHAREVAAAAVEAGLQEGKKEAEDRGLKPGANDDDKDTTASKKAASAKKSD